MSELEDTKKKVNTITNLPIQNELRQIPTNLETERALLGAILTNNKAYEHIEEIVSESDFAEPLNKEIFSYTKSLIDKGKIADLNTIKLFLENNERFKELGGIEYLLKITEDSVSIINAAHYGKVISDLSKRRELIVFGTDLVNDSFLPKPDEDALHIIEKAEQQLYDLSTDGKIETGPKDFENLINETMEYIEKAYQKDSSIVGLKTGFKDFDKKISGLHNSDLIILAGRPSMGKTAFATNIAYNITTTFEKKKIEHSDSKGTVLFFSLEMSSEQLVTRLLSESSDVPSQKIRSGEISKLEFSKIVKSSEKISNLSMFIDDSPALTISSIRTRARRIKRKEGLDLIIIDYLQLIESQKKIVMIIE